jgi:hypothetical protein
MTIEQFGSATPYVQKTMLKFHGRLLLKKASSSSTKLLYQLDGFYVEVTHSAARNNRLHMQSYSVNDIDEYLGDIDISAIHHLLL